MAIDLSKSARESVSSDALMAIPPVGGIPWRHTHASKILLVSRDAWQFTPRAFAHCISHVIVKSCRCLRDRS